MGRCKNRVRHVWFFTRAEYIISKDGFLDRDGFYVETRKSFRPSYLSNKPLLILARYGGLNIEPGGTWEAQLDDPHTWDRTMLTLAAVYNLTEYAKIKLEYYITGEETGDTKKKQNRIIMDREENISQTW